jgi:pimeloyl-ACP methyl ester carboxylesterase
VSFVLLHGLGSDRRQPLELFAPVLEAAGATAGHVIAPDLRAHGQSTVVGEPADFALDRLADEVAAEVRGVLVAHGDGTAASAPLTIMGISMGAALALRIALRGSLPIERAVFVRPAFDDSPLPANLRVFPVIGQLLADLGPDAGLARFRELEPYHRVAEASPAGARALLTQFTAPDAARRARRLVEIPRNRAFGAGADSELGGADSELGRLGARGIRSLVVGARRDPVHPVELSERWAAGLGAPLEVVPARDDGQAAQTAALRDRIGHWLAGG